MTGPFELTLSRDVPAAATNRDQCVAFAAAERAERDNLFSDAVTRYLNHRRTYPSSTLAPFVHQYLKRTYSTWAGMLRRAGEHTKGIEVYRALLTETGVEPDAERVREDLAQTHLELAAEARDQLPTAEPEARVTRARTAVDALLVVRRELGDTTAAQTVPQAVVDTYTAANSLFTEQRFCDALPVLDYFVTVPDADTAGVVGAANADRAVAMLECGLAAYRGGDFRTAIDRLTAMATAYPEHPGTAQARSAVIAANVALFKEGTPPVLPAPLGDNAPGSISVTFYNNAPREALVRITGPTHTSSSCRRARTVPPTTTGARRSRASRRRSCGWVRASTTGWCPRRSRPRPPRSPAPAPTSRAPATPTACSSARRSDEQPFRRGGISRQRRGGGRGSRLDGGGVRRCDRRAVPQSAVG